MTAPRKPKMSTLPDEPIGILPDGTLNVIKIDDPPFQPKVVDDRGAPVPELDRAAWKQTR
jgi:hypothetical protein